MTNKCQDWKTMELNATELGMSSMTKTSELAEYLNLNNGDSLVCISLARELNATELGMSSMTKTS